MTKLVCPDCQHENEAERIYCHNCGARLDRTPVIDGKPSPEVIERETRKHLKKMFRSNRGQGKLLAKKLAKTVFEALLVAALIVMVLPSPDLPPITTKSDFAPMINMDIVSATSSSQPATLSYSEDQVNSYLASSVRRTNSPAKEGYFPLRHVMVQFQEGSCRIHTVRQFLGLSIYSGGSYQVTIENGKILSKNTGGYIGRMPIHPSLMDFAGIILHKTWDALDRERKSVAKLTRIEFHPQSVTLIAGR